MEPGLERRAARAVLTLGIAMVATAVEAAFDIAHLGTLDGGTADARRASEQRLDVAGTVQGALLIATVVAFLLWFVQAWNNLPRLGVERRTRLGFVWWSWFIPLVNLVRPKQMTNDMWRAGGDEPVAPLLHWWWAFWLLSNFLTNSALRLGIDPDGVDEMRAATQMDLVASLATIVAAVLAIAVVRSVTLRQLRAAAAL